MKKKTYCIGFYYYKDCRIEVNVESYNQVCALVNAMDEVDCDEWIGDEDGYRIEIKKAKVDKE